MYRRLCLLPDVRFSEHASHTNARAPRAAATPVSASFLSMSATIDVTAARKRCNHSFQQLRLPDSQRSRRRQTVRSIIHQILRPPSSLAIVSCSNLLVVNIWTTAAQSGSTASRKGTAVILDIQHADIQESVRESPITASRPLWPFACNAWFAPRAESNAAGTAARLTASRSALLRPSRPIRRASAPE
jgi:hypothetical protein